jgi:hypothetical protein
MPRCSAISSKTGKKCKHNAKLGEIYCASHINVRTPKIPEPEPMHVVDDIEDCDPSFILQLPTSSLHIHSPVSNSAPLVNAVPLANADSELAYLRSLNAIYVEVIAKLTRALQEKKGPVQKPVRRVRKMDENTMLKVAKQLYYKEHKRTASIIEEIKTRFNHGGMGEVTTVPWQLVKHVTDKFFDALSPQDRDIYLSLARQAIAVTQT